MVDKEKPIFEVPKGAAPEAAGTPSKAETVESKPTASLEAGKPMPENVSEQVPVATPAPTPITPAAPVVQKDELTAEIEEVLSEDLGDLYKSLPPEKKEQFKREGEKTAGLIRQMISHGKFHGRRVLGLIVKWLKLIPGVNKFFLEQESKIKTDKLQMLSEEQKKNRL